MKLSDYLTQSQKSADIFAKEIGVTVSAVNFWRNGDRIPRIGQMQKIFEITQGAVTPTDFLPFRSGDVGGESSAVENARTLGAAE